MINEQYNIILFDGVCNLCNGFVKFIIHQDKSSRFKLASLQSAVAIELLEKGGFSNFPNNSIVYISAEKVYFKSTAVLCILKQMGYPWKVLYAFIILPQFIRDGLYNIIARNRYRIFGKRNQCMIPSDNIKKRFL